MDHLEEIREQLLRKRTSLASKLEELDAAIHGIDMARKHSGARPGARVGRRSPLADAVRQTVVARGDVFDAANIYGAVGDTPRATLRSVSRILGRLAERGEIVCVVEGTGTRAARYRRKGVIDAQEG